MMYVALMQNAVRFARTLVPAMLCLCSTAAFAAPANDYPNRPVRLVSGYAPGGTTSLVGRLIGQKLSESWGQQFILDNRPGGGTLIAGEIVARAPPDGYTLMLVDSVHVLAPVLLKAPFDPINDFTAIASVAQGELVLLLHPSMPSKTLSDFLAYAKARPGKLQYATPALAGAQHLTTEIFNIATGIQTLHVPYKGAGPALVALVAGEVNFYFATVATGAPHAKGGRARAIAVTGKKRSPLLTDVPTFDEAGLANFYDQPRPGFGIVGPARIPRPIVDKLAAEVNKHLAQTEFRDSLVNLGLDPNPSSTGDYLNALKGSMAWNIKTIALLRQRGVKFDM